VDALLDALPRRFALDAPDPEADDGDALDNGVAKLVLALVKLLHDVLEKQAIRRMDAGTLTDAEVERVGRALMLQAEQIREMCDLFGLDPADLNLDLGTVETVE
jgi:hypothetical protein